MPIRRSITPDFLICLDDGKRFKSLRRHLAGLGMTPAQYREKWNLPSDYPMVAPKYAARRGDGDVADRSRSGLTIPEAPTLRARRTAM